jgi:hypothetical protein
VGCAHRADDRTGPGDGEGGCHRLPGTDALEGGVHADPLREFHDRVVGGLAAFRDDVGGAERPCQDVAAGGRLSAMMRAAPSRRAAITAQRPTAPSPTNATMLPGRTPPQ